MDGGMSLPDTFWKFGVLGLLTLNLLVKMFGNILLQHLHGFTIFEYFLSSARQFGIETSTAIITFLYLSGLMFLLFYTIIIVVGTWRSSAEYNRSLWFRHLARILVLLMAFFTLQTHF